MEVKTTTKLIALLGSPLKQSFAAAIQNEAFEAEGLDYFYFPVEVGNDGIKPILDAVRVMNFAGLVVTKPNKVFVCGLLDELDPLAEAMGAVNTVVKTGEGKLVGYNTDGLACVKSLRADQNVDVERSVFFCIGAGGVGRAIAYTLAYCGAKKIYVTDLMPEAAEDLCAAIERKYPGVARVVAMDDLEQVNRAAADSGVVMNLTGLGMGGHIGEMPFTGEIFRPGQVAFDAIYNPPVTKFLEEAEKKGCRTLNGMNMNVYQGSIGYQLHTGRPAPIEQMRKTVERLLGR